MSNIPVSSLPLAISLTGDEIVPIVQGGTTKRTTVAAIARYPFATAPTFLTHSNSPYAVRTTDLYLICDTSGGAIEILLPPLASRGVALYVNGTNAATNAVTVTPAGSETIDGQSEVSLTNDYQSIWLYPLTTTAWLL